MKRNLYHTRLSRGFTLIELLVVITIIATLAAILFPVFAQAKESAKKANCISNIKQISLASLLYAHDYDDRLIHYLHYFIPNYVYKGSAPYTARMNWFGVSLPPGMLIDGLPWDTTHGRLYPYMKNTKVSDCPVGFEWCPRLTLSGPTTITFTQEAGGADASDIEAPAETIGFSDAMQTSPTVPYITPIAIYALACGFGTNQARHNDIASIGFLDGHVKGHKLWIPSQSIAAGYVRWKAGYLLKIPKINPNDVTPLWQSTDCYYYSIKKPSL